MLRVSGWAAIAGGGLRIADTFTTQVLPQSTLDVLYFVTDVLLLAGIAGLWTQRRATLGLAGTIGIAVFVGGILTVRASAFGIGTYQLGSLLALIGLAAYSGEVLIGGKGAAWAPLLWLTAFAAALSGALAGQAMLWFAVSAVAFGLGFVAAGVTLLKD